MTPPVSPLRFADICKPKDEITYISVPPGIGPDEMPVAVARQVPDLALGAAYGNGPALQSRLPLGGAVELYPWCNLVHRHLSVAGSAWLD